MNLHSVSALLLSLMTVAACGGEDDTAGTEADAQISQADAMPLSPSCLEAADKSDILWIQENIFNSCSAFSVCHQGAAASAGGLNLESGLAEAALINVKSTLFPAWNMVVPGDPDNSYLMVILGSVEGPLEESVGTMPYNNPLLCQPKRDAVARWILSLPTP